MGVIVTFGRHPLSGEDFQALRQVASRISLGIQRRQTEEELQVAKVEGGGGDRGEVDVPRQHEPRDPHPDERHHRDDAPGAEDGPDAQAARLSLQGARSRQDRCSASSTTFSTSRRSRRANWTSKKPSSGSRTSSRICPRWSAQKANDKNLEFLIAAQPDIPPNLVGDPLRLGQILINLVNNAVKFTERGEVIVSAAVEETAPSRVKLKFSVRDTGIGMTPEQTARLFQAFTPGRHIDHAQVRRHGPRPFDQQAAGGDDGRQHLGGERAGRRQHVPSSRRGSASARPAWSASGSSRTWRASGPWWWTTIRRLARSSAMPCADSPCGPSTVSSGEDCHP